MPSACRGRSISPGLFFTFEGPEGCGKSTQMQKFSDWLKARGFPVVLTREPGGTPCGDAIRGIFLEHARENLEPETELFLMLAQRTEHWRKVIAPGVADGKFVLCDRYLDSSLAYQGYGRGLGAEKILRMHRRFLGSCLPNTTIVFSFDPALGLMRAQARGKKHLDRMESETLPFHRRVLAGYLELARKHPGRFLVVDADGTIETVFSSLLDKLQKKHPSLRI